MGSFINEVMQILTFFNTPPSSATPKCLYLFFIRLPPEFLPVLGPLTG